MRHPVWRSGSLPRSLPLDVWYLHGNACLTSRRQALDIRRQQGWDRLACKTGALWTSLRRIIQADCDGLAAMVAARKLYPGAALVLPGRAPRTRSAVSSPVHDLGLTRLKDLELCSRSPGQISRGYPGARAPGTAPATVYASRGGPPHLRPPSRDGGERQPRGRAMRSSKSLNLSARPPRC